MQETRVSIRRYNFNEDKQHRFYDVANQSFNFGSPWTIKQFEETLAREDLVFYVAEIDDHLIGYIGGKLILDEAEIYMIVVSKEFQNQHIAHHLLDRFEEECRMREIGTIYLEVRESNKEAQAFYKNNKFEIISVREKYYTDPIENAIIMKSTKGKKEKNGKEANLSDRDKL